MDFFLKIKHWMLFLLMYGFLIMMPFLMIFLFVFAKNPTHSGSPDQFAMNIIVLIILFVMISVFSLFGWIYSISIGLQKLYPENVKYKTKAFQIFIVSIIIIYSILFMSILFAIAGGFEYFIEPNPIAFLLIFFLVFMPLMFYSAFCQIYITIFAAKSYKTAVLQRKVTFKDFVGEFFLIYFSMVGIWVLQPKINRLYKTIQKKIE